MDLKLLFEASLKDYLLVLSYFFSHLQVGLAVDDIKGVQEKAVLKRLAMQVYVLRSASVISRTTIMYRAILSDVIVKYCLINIRLCLDIILDVNGSKQLR